MSEPIIDPEILSKAANTLRIIAHPERLRIIERLAEGESSVGKLVQTLNLPQAVISKHLALLKKAGVLKCNSVANFRHYSILNSHILKVLDCIKQSCQKEV